MSEHLRAAARHIAARAMRTVDVAAATGRHITLNATELRLAGTSVARYDVERVVLVAIGKAAMPMYTAAAHAMDGLEMRGVVVAPAETLPNAAPRGTILLPGDHPMPTAASFHAANIILQTLAQVTPRTVVLFLISGGASAMVELPLDPAMTLNDVRAFSRALVGSGMDITAMNTLRKHLSAVKGGRLGVAAASAAMQCTLLISDVPSAAPDAIGSGPSLPDSTSIEDCRRLFRRLHSIATLPESVIRWFQSPALPHTADVSDPAFRRAHWQVVLSSEHLAAAAVTAAQAQGFHTEVDNTCDEWEYRDAARYLMDRAHTLAGAVQRPVCLVSVGEIAVALPNAHGEGGRNQQFALWCAQALAEEGQGMTVLSIGSDGVDGHSSAAGAACDETTVKRADPLGFSVEHELTNFNAAPLLHALGDTIKTGPTGNNLRDLRVLLVDPN